MRSHRGLAWIARVRTKDSYKHKRHQRSGFNTLDILQIKCSSQKLAVQALYRVMAKLVKVGREYVGEGAER